MLPHEGLSTAIANMININISTTAGVSTFQGISIHIISLKTDSI